MSLRTLLERRELLFELWRAQSFMRTAINWACGRQLRLKRAARRGLFSPKTETRGAYCKERVMPIFLFPGQGSQKAGMAQLFQNAAPQSREVFERARAVLPESVMRVMMEGDQEALNDTRNAQPALVCVETAVTVYLDAIGVRPDRCAGHSLGEIAALVAAGALVFEEALRLVVERARLMSVNAPPGGMAAVLGLSAEQIGDLLPEDVQIANYNGPAQTIISGTHLALDAAAERLKSAGAKRVLSLPVSGPFHSKFMIPAAEQFACFLETVDLTPPRIPFVSSVSGCPEDNPERLRSLLAEQLYRPVQWTDVMILFGGVSAVEIGPGGVLRGLARRMDKGPEVAAADSVEACNALRDALE